MQDEFYMKKALEEAQKAAEKDEVPIGAVLVQNGKILARAHNLREKNQIATQHAEMMCIEKACKKTKSWRLEDCTLYVTLEPCPMCAGAIYQSRIKRVVFGAKDPKGGSYGSCFDLNQVKGLNHYPEITSGVMSEVCSEQLTSYFKQKRIQKKQKKEEVNSLSKEDSSI